jgi:hypothetical protein
MYPSTYSKGSSKGAAKGIWVLSTVLGPPLTSQSISSLSILFFGEVWSTSSWITSTSKSSLIMSVSLSQDERSRVAGSLGSFCETGGVDKVMLQLLANAMGKSSVAEDETVEKELTVVAADNSGNSLMDDDSPFVPDFLESSIFSSLQREIMILISKWSENI